LCESAPLWSFIQHLFVQDETAVAANGFARVIIVNEIFAAALLALVNQALMCSGCFFFAHFSNSIPHLRKTVTFFSFWAEKTVYSARAILNGGTEQIYKLCCSNN
jgi:hypothetical protein